MVNLTIGGGNIKGLAYLGVLEYLYLNNLISNNEKDNNYIKNFYGSSVGAIVGFGFIIGYSPMEFLNILIDINLEHYWDFDISNIEKKYSLISDIFFKKLKEIYSKKVDPDITFKQFHDKYNINLNIYATSLTRRKNICFNSTSYPDYKVITIIQASASIPIIFPPVIINNEYFIDGCMKCIDGVSNGIISNDNNIHYVIKSNYCYYKIYSFTDYLIQTLNCTLQNDEFIETKYTICIKTDDNYKSKLNFNDIKTSDKLKLFFLGLETAKEKLHSILNTENKEKEDKKEENKEEENKEENKEEENKEEENKEEINKKDNYTQTDDNTILIKS